MSKVPALLSLFVLTTLAFAPGCSNTNCIPIRDGTYVAIDSDGGILFTDGGAASTDAGDASAGGAELTYVFQNGLPAPYSDSTLWTCDTPTLTCEMAYVCSNGTTTRVVVTSFSLGTLGFSVTDQSGNVLDRRQLNPQPM